MTLGEKERLLDALSKSQAATRAIWESVDPEMQVYGDTDWCVRDIIAHLAVWDHQVVKSLRAYRSGSEYAIPDLDDDEFNQQMILVFREMTAKSVLEQCEQAREEFKAAIQDIPTEMYPGDMLYPWGDEHGSIAQLVNYMIEHDTEHRQEILKAIQAS